MEKKDFKFFPSLQSTEHNALILRDFWRKDSMFEKKVIINYKIPLQTIRCTPHSSNALSIRILKNVRIPKYVVHLSNIPENGFNQKTLR